MPDTSSVTVLAGRDFSTVVVIPIFILRSRPREVNSARRTQISVKESRDLACGLYPRSWPGSQLIGYQLNVGQFVASGIDFFAVIVYLPPVLQGKIFYAIRIICRLTNRADKLQIIDASADGDAIDLNEDNSAERLAYPLTTVRLDQKIFIVSDSYTVQ
jgi:hypothetical protein